MLTFNQISIEDFLSSSGTFIDVRSPLEFSKGHILNAINIPLFDDKQREEIGTIYKKQGSEIAIQVGFKYASKKFPDFLNKVKSITSPLKIYCARGGMRSQSMANFFSKHNYQCLSLKKGYKRYRNHILHKLTQPLKIIILGGSTGCGKTQILQILKKQHCQVVDLENLAKHRGSSFGHLPNISQPSNEQFENLIAHNLQEFNTDLPIWMEQESRLIGKCKIPDLLFSQMLKAPVITISRPLSQRLNLIWEEYHIQSKDSLIKGVEKLRKRLGEKQTDTLISWIEKGLLKKSATQILKYYDKTYNYFLKKHSIEPKYSLFHENWSNIKWAEELKAHENCFF
jgi:tRNA 2-selenouridine synthase